MPDGTLITSGGDIADAVRVSLIPQIPLFARHDMLGQVFIRRFMRAFKRSVVEDLIVRLTLLRSSDKSADSRIAAKAAQDEKGIVLATENSEPEKPIKEMNTCK